MDSECFYCKAFQNWFTPTSALYKLGKLGSKLFNDLPKSHLGQNQKSNAGALVHSVQMGKRDGNEVDRVNRELVVSQPAGYLIFIKHNFLKLFFLQLSRY